jgi:hypothetical protein
MPVAIRSVPFLRGEGGHQGTPDPKFGNVFSATQFAGDWHLVHLGSRAAGGVALVIVEATTDGFDGRPR